MASDWRIGGRKRSDRRGGEPPSTGASPAVEAPPPPMATCRGLKKLGGTGGTNTRIAYELKSARDEPIPARFYAKMASSCQQIRSWHRVWRESVQSG